MEVEEKLFSRYCPKCGELYTSLEIASINLGSGMQVNMSCANSHKWSEFYSLSYTGYWWDGARYDSYGNIISNNKVEEK